MTFEYDEKGKIFTDIVSKVSIPARVQRTTHLIHGHLHVRRDQRIKDELDLNENFLAMTDVTVMGPDGQTLFQAPFLAVGVSASTRRPRGRMIRSITRRT